MRPQDCSRITKNPKVWRTTKGNGSNHLDPRIPFLVALAVPIPLVIGTRTRISYAWNVCAFHATTDAMRQVVDLAVSPGSVSKLALTVSFSVAVGSGRGRLVCIPLSPLVASLRAQEAFRSFFDLESSVVNANVFPASVQARLPKHGRVVAEGLVNDGMA
mmetsp:Transcript_20525/g.38409  ORF Transcript_20525/g.38409 Transcript_20525/m.38409 type:complete len:160 (+) Transcript_20525:77-556(+)